MQSNRNQQGDLHRPSTSLGLRVAELSSEWVNRPLLFIEVREELLEEHAQAARIHQSHEKLFPGYEVVLWGNQTKEAQSLFASGEVMEALPFLLGMQKDWRWI